MKPTENKKRETSPGKLKESKEEVEPIHSLKDLVRNDKVSIGKTKPVVHKSVNLNVLNKNHIKVSELKSYADKNMAKKLNENESQVVEVMPSQTKKKRKKVDDSNFNLDDANDLQIDPNMQDILDNLGNDDYDNQGE